MTKLEHTEDAGPRDELEYAKSPKDMVTLTKIARQKSDDIPGQKEEIGKKIESAEEDRERKETWVRKFVTTGVAGLFIFVVIIAVIFAIIAHYSPPAGGSDRLFEQVQSILQGPVLSVLNLVLGYYFGAARLDRRRL